MVVSELPENLEFGLHSLQLHVTVPSSSDFDCLPRKYSARIDSLRHGIRISISSATQAFDMLIRILFKNCPYCRLGRVQKLPNIWASNGLRWRSSICSSVSHIAVHRSIYTNGSSRIRRWETPRLRGRLRVRRRSEIADIFERSRRGRELRKVVKRRISIVPRGLSSLRVRIQSLV